MTSFSCLGTFPTMYQNTYIYIYMCVYIICIVCMYACLFKYCLSHASL